MPGFAEIPRLPPSASVSSEVVAVHCVLGCVGGGGVMMAKFGGCHLGLCFEGT